MPELPEVEIVRRRLHPRVTGRVVTAVEVTDAKVSPSSAAELREAIAGRRIVDTARRGKWLILRLGAPGAGAAAERPGSQSGGRAPSGACLRSAVAATSPEAPVTDPAVAATSPDPAAAGAPPAGGQTPPEPATDQTGVVALPADAQTPPEPVTDPAGVVASPEAPDPGAAYAAAAVQDGPVEMLAVVHLRMTGRLLFEPDAESPRCRPRFTLRFDDGSKLFFYDVRRFGGLWAVPAAHADRFFAGLGVEPLSDDFTAGELRRLLAGRRTPLKGFLLDQRRLAGVGNIYADEALFRARLHPLRPAGSVGPREAQRLHAAVRETLQLGIDHEGSSVESFVDPAGDRGHFQEILNVYQRTGEPCRVCGTPIRRITLGGRGTHFCPRCQPRRGMQLRPAPKE